MAKWGEGDPRWIVEERPDATNVNNWHWSDKDASVWSKEKLKTLMVGLAVENREGKCETVEVTSCTGEATANNRKGKLIFFYEWNIKVKWKGTPSVPSLPASSSSSSDDEEVDTKEKKKKEKEKGYTGEIEIPNLSEENDLEDIDVIVTIKKADKMGQKLKELMHREAPAVIRDKIAEYLHCLKEEYSVDLILPKRDTSPSLPTQKKKQTTPTTSTLRQNSLSTTTTTTTTNTSASRPSGSPIGCRIYTAKVSMTESFLASVEDLYNALTEKELVEAFTQTKAVIDCHRGGVFSILDGLITGEFLECVRPSKIVQKWRLKNWPDGHYSTVTLSLKQNIHSAELSLLQTEVPEADCDRTREGWKRYIFQRIKMTFGYGTQLF